MPDATEVAKALASADLAKSAFSMQGAARGIARDDLRLQRPIAVRLGRGDQGVDQRCTDRFPASDF